MAHPVLLDGATGTECERRGLPVDPSLFWAGWVDTHPETVLAIHEEYVRAGAQVITTCTFCTSPFVLEQAGMKARVESLNRRAVELARTAVRNAGDGREVLVAGGVPAIGPHFREYYDDFPGQIEPLADAGADIILIEMACRETEVRKATGAAVATGLPTWVGMTCQIADGGSYLGVFDRADHVPVDSCARAAKAAEDLGAAALLAMHTPVGMVPPTLAAMQRATKLPVGAYANNPKGAWLDPGEYAEHAQAWVAQGAAFVGGCCGTRPAHIRTLRNALS